MVIGLGVAFGQDAGVARGFVEFAGFLRGHALADGVERGFHDLGGIHEPLVGQVGLNRHLGPVAMGDHVAVFVDPVEPAIVARFGHDGIARLVAVHAVVAFDGRADHVGGAAFGEIVIAAQEHRRAGGHDVDGAKPGALAHFHVVEIMRGRDLDRAGALFGVGIFVGHDGDGATTDRQRDGLADQMRIAPVLGVDGHAGIAQHRFGAGGGDGQVIAGFPVGRVAFLVELDRVFVGLAAIELVAQAPHLAVHLDLLDLQVGNRGFEMRVPVHQPLAAIDEALVVHLHEDLDHRVVEIGAVAGLGVASRAAHGEGLARPVAGGAEALQLPDDGAARLDLLLPDAVQKRLAAHLAAGGFALGGHLAFGHHLRGDACVVRAGLPERVKAAHPVPAHQDILKRVVEGMAHVQAAGHIGRRDHDAERLVPAGIGASGKSVRFFPFRGDPRLGLGGVKGLFHRLHVPCLSSEGDLSASRGKAKAGCRGFTGNSRGLDSGHGVVTYVGQARRSRS